MPIVHNTLKYTWLKLAPFVYFIISFIFLLILWKLFSWKSDGDIPGPNAGFLAFKELFIDMSPMYEDPNEPNNKGILIMMLSSLIRVFKGFLMGSLIAIPLGFIMGSSKIWNNILNPIVQILRPVSPLTWLPLGMIALKSAEGATIFMIFITSLWPTLINTAQGVAALPNDHKNVAKAFGFSKFKYITKIVIPFALPYIITGLRLSIGVAWMVIVAGEMLTGGIGIGSFAWESYNGGALEKVILAIFLTGLMGLLLDKIFNYLQKKYSFA